MAALWANFNFSGRNDNTLWVDANTTPNVLSFLPLLAILPVLLHCYTRSSCLCTFITASNYTKLGHCLAGCWLTASPMFTWLLFLYFHILISDVCLRCVDWESSPA